MDWSIAVAGGLSLLGAAIHGIVGDRFLRKAPRDALPSNPWGGPASSMAFVRVSWHLVTITFGISGIALLYAASSGAEHLQGMIWFLGVLYTCFALFAVSGAVMQQRLGLLFRHPAPLVLTSIAVLLWWSSASI